MLKNLTGRKLFCWAPYLYTGVLAALFASVKLFDPDLWWHLATGHFILARGIPTVNTFSYTNPGYPWQHAEWLFDSVLALADSLFGLLGVESVQILLVTAAFIITLDTIRRQSGGRTPATYLLLLPLALAVSWIRFTPRPHLVTYVGLALLLNLRQRKLRRPLLAMALLGAVWGNSHSGVVFGAVAALLMPVASLLEGAPTQARRDGVAALAFLAGSLANPNFWYPYQDAIFHLGVTGVVPLNEFRRANLWGEPFFFLLAALAVAVIPACLRRRRFLHPLLAAAFIPLAFSAIRVIPKCTLMVLPGMVLILEEWRRGLRERFGAPAALLFACLLGLVSLAGVVREGRAVFVPNRFGWGVNWKHVPEGACRFIEENNLRGNLYNDFAQGGYLIWRLWPGRSVFQDGRVPVYPPAFLRGIFTAFRDPDGAAWPALMDRYRVEYAVVDRMPFGDGIDAGSRFAAMQWVPVYMDGVSYVYLRPGSVNRLVEESRGLAHLGYRESPDDLYLMGQMEPAAVRREVGRIDPRRLILAEDYDRLAMAALGAGDPALAERFLAAGLREHADDRELRLLRDAVDGREKGR